MTVFSGRDVGNDQPGAAVSRKMLKVMMREYGADAKLQ